MRRCPDNAVVGQDERPVEAKVRVRPEDDFTDRRCHVPDAAKCAFDRVRAKAPHAEAETFCKTEDAAARRALVRLVDERARALEERAPDMRRRSKEAATE